MGEFWNSFPVISAFSMSGQRKFSETDHESRRNHVLQTRGDESIEVWNQVRQHADKNFAEAKSLFETIDLMQRKTDIARKQNEGAKLQYLRQLNAMTR